MKNITRKIKYPTVAVMYMSLFRFNSSAYDKVITIKVITPKTYSNLVEYNYFMVKVIIANETHEIDEDYFIVFNILLFSWRPITFRERSYLKIWYKEISALLRLPHFKEYNHYERRE